MISRTFNIRKILLNSVLFALCLILPGCDSGGGREGLNTGVEVRISIQDQVNQPIQGAIIRFDDEQNLDGDALFEETDSNGEARILVPENSAVLLSVVTPDAISETFDLMTGTTSLDLNLQVLEDENGVKSIVISEEESTDQSNQSAIESSSEDNQNEAVVDNGKPATPQPSIEPTPTPSLEPTPTPTPDLRVLIPGTIDFRALAGEISNITLTFVSARGLFEESVSVDSNGNFELNVPLRYLSSELRNSQTNCYLHLRYNRNGTLKRPGMSFTFTNFESYVLGSQRLNFRLSDSDRILIPIVNAEPTLAIGETNQSSGGSSGDKGNQSLAENPNNNSGAGSDKEEFEEIEDEKEEEPPVTITPPINDSSNTSGSSSQFSL